MCFDRKMPDRILDDFSNLRTVVEQFRALGRSDTHILETIMDIADIKNIDDIPGIDTMLKSQRHRLQPKVNPETGEIIE